jgi:hypothetical protein
MCNKSEIRFKAVEINFLIDKKFSFCVGVKTPMSDFFNRSITDLFSASFEMAIERYGDSTLSVHDAESYGWLAEQGACALHRCGAEFVNNMHKFMAFCWSAVEDECVEPPSTYFEFFDSWFHSSHPSSIRFSLEFITLTSCLRSLMNQSGEDAGSIESIAKAIFSALEWLYESGPTYLVDLDPASYSGNHMPFTRGEVMSLLNNWSLRELMERDCKYQSIYSHVFEQWRMADERF